ncbi:MAG: MATE family efflux transporter [Sandaracinaceae bacterium]
MPALPPERLTHRRILALAGPVMVSNVTTPLLGVVDTAVVGRIPDPAYLGAVAVGSLVFTFVFWAFGFLRMGTTGLTSQAVGARDGTEVGAALGRSVLLGAAFGLLLLALLWPIRELAFGLLPGSAKVEGLARGYVDLRFLAAPATLMNYALLGWFLGLGQARTALVLQLVLNGANIVLDATFVLALGWGVRGVALGTVLAEALALALGLWLAARALRGYGPLRLAAIRQAGALRRTVGVNLDIMVRSLALMAVFVVFTAEGARRGDVILAANAVLLQLISVSAFFLDGVAYAAEALVGRAVGAADRRGLEDAVRMTTAWAAALAVGLSAVYAATGPWLIDALTVDAGARATARAFLPWAVAGPVVGVWAFQLDGIFIGATRGPDMRNASLLSLAIFGVAYAGLVPWGNHGLWASLFVHYGARTGTLLAYVPGLLRDVGSPAADGSGAGRGRGPGLSSRRPPPAEPGRPGTRPESGR